MALTQNYYIQADQSYEAWNALNKDYPESWSNNWLVQPFPKPEPKPVYKLDDIIVTKYPTGSRFICDPAPMDTDNDTVVLVNKPLKEIYHFMIVDGWDTKSSQSYGDESEQKFYSFRKGVENWIVVDDPEYYSKWVNATLLAKRFNLLNKADRIALFEVVVKGANVF